MFFKNIFLYNNVRFNYLKREHQSNDAINLVFNDNLKCFRRLTFNLCLFDFMFVFDIVKTKHKSTVKGEQALSS